MRRRARNVDAETAAVGQGSAGRATNSQRAQLVRRARDVAGAAMRRIEGQHDARAAAVRFARPASSAARARPSGAGATGSDDSARSRRTAYTAGASPSP
jgi:hypothetical protein